MKNGVSIFICFISIFISVEIFSMTNHNDKDPVGNYENLWKEVDSLDQLGLRRSAHTASIKIFDLAKKEGNSAQIVKAMIHRIKFQDQTEENAILKNISDLKTETVRAKSPERLLLHSMLGELYWRYYQFNRYRFFERSQTVGIEEDDPATWDLTKIIHTCHEHYAASLSETDKSKKAAITAFDEVLIVGTPLSTRKYRPTLYDFLVHRALEFYSNSELELTKPAEQFDINDPAYFGIAEEFVNMQFSTQDTLSYKYRSCLLFRDLLAFHLNDKDPGALIDADKQRLSFIRNSTSLPSKDSLYEVASLNIIRKYKDHVMSSEILMDLATMHEQNANQYDPETSEQYRWEFHKAIEYCKAIINDHPVSPAATLAKDMIHRIQDSALGFMIESVNPMGRVFRAKVEYRNLKKIHCRVYLDITDNLSQEDRYGEQLLIKLLKENSLTEWNVDLPVDTDYHSHSIEIAIPSFDFGKYILLISDQDDFDPETAFFAYGSFRISDMGLLGSGRSAGMNEFYVVDRISGEPLQKVAAEVSGYVYNRNTSVYDTVVYGNYLSDKDGRFEILPIKEQGRNYNIKLSSGNDRLFLNEGFYQYRNNRNKRDVIERTLFFTDRKIYRPGQLIYFKALIMQVEDELPKILPGHSTTIQFYNVNGELISEQKLRSNDFGTVEGVFTAPEGILNGSMQIRNNSGSVSINVEEYKRPRFEVNFNPVEGTFKVGEKIEITGTAQTYSGVPVDGALIKYRVHRTAVYQPWCYWFRGFYPQQARQEILSGETRCDEKGNFKFSFIADADENTDRKFEPVFNFQVNADVTDLNGETRTTSMLVSAGYTSLILSTDLPDSYNADDKTAFQIMSKNLSGNKVATKISLSVSKIKEPERLLRSRMWPRADRRIYSEEEYSKKFPWDVYDNEDKFINWEKEREVWSIEINTGIDSVIQFPAENWEPGFYVLEGKAIDTYGEEVKLLHYFTAYHSTSKKASRNEIAWIHALKDDAKPGENNKILISTAARNSFVLIRTELKNEIVSSQWIRIGNEQKIIEIPVKEEYRGNFTVGITLVKEGRVFKKEILFKVPWESKDLSVEYETFRSVLEPGKKEQWKIKLKDHADRSINAEVLASMYDASLDAFIPHSWDQNLYNTYGIIYGISYYGFNVTRSNPISKRTYNYRYDKARTYDQLNWFHMMPLDMIAYSMDGGMEMNSRALSKGAPATGVSSASEVGIQADENLQAPEVNEGSAEAEPSIRKNLQETAFFYPQLNVEADSTLIVSFTSPEALTRWKFQLFAHTKDLKYVIDEREVITQKELMLTPNIPRFFRAGDTISVVSKVNTLKEEMQEGVAEMQILDAFTMKEVNTLFGNTEFRKNFSISKDKSGSLQWDLIIPARVPAVVMRITAKVSNFSDAEEHLIPVLTNRQLVTEALPVWTKTNEVKNYEFKKLLESTSKTLEHHQLRLEYTTNPIWTVVQALPYLMEYPYDCSEQLFSRYYANTIASHIANSSERIKQIFDSWKKLSPSTFLSNLEKDRDLKSLILEETPWVAEAGSESERKERIAILFDLNRLSSEQSLALSKLKKQQMPGGAWAWFEGMPDNRYMTQHIVTGLLQLQHLKVLSKSEEEEIKRMTGLALNYLDSKVAQEYEKLKQNKADLNTHVPSSLAIQYLYMRSFESVRTQANTATEAKNYFMAQASKYWLKYNEYMQAMISLTLFREDNSKSISHDIIRSLKDNAIQSDELGMYWKNNNGGYYWDQANIETQAMLIEAFNEVSKDIRSVENMKLWLVRQKQTRNWKSTKATVAACYALLLRGSDWLKEENVVQIKLGDRIIKTDDNNPNKEVGTGEFSISWSGEEVKKEMGKIQISSFNKTDGTSSNVSWGAVYWQYFEDLDKITAAGTNALQLSKNLFVERMSPKGPVIEKIEKNTNLRLGDRIIVRISLRTDRDMEYLHLKDLRASGLEPENVLSGYKWQDGFGYYESTGDAATNFFISFLPKGTYVFEYSLRAAQSGEFSTGITTIQNMYAPEFSSHSFGERLQILGQ
jgi:hypothetical protein